MTKEVKVKNLFHAVGDTLSLAEEPEENLFVLSRNEDKDYLSSFTSEELDEIEQLIRALHDAARKPNE